MRITRGPLPVEDALDIVIQVAQGLEKSHESGIVHRDIKPANLIITKDGLVKIVDFGIAKLLGATGPTRTGTTLGTVSYMSPEQIAGEDADQQSDVWSLGAVLYEMLAGQQPFPGENQWAVMHAISNRTPKSLPSLRDEVSHHVERVVLRALEKSREKRYGSATEFLKEAKDARRALTQPVSTETASSASPWQALATPRAAVLMLAFAGSLAAGAYWLANRDADARWAREQALPEIVRLIEEDSYASAYRLAEEAESFIPQDPDLARLWPLMSTTGSIVTIPTGADVYAREYASLEGDWEHLGQSPLNDIRLPRGTFRWRIEKDGYEPQILARRSAQLLQDSTDQPPTLPEKGGVPPGMVLVPGGTSAVRITGLDLYDGVTLGPCFIDQHEVTNREFKEFVDSAGYKTEQYWSSLDFVKDGRRLSWEEAMAVFQDSTGRPGPAAWELGDYPEGQDDYPVTNVSWYEAAAYANFRGKSLPTVFHWDRARGPVLPAAMAVSNFSHEGPTRVGVHLGLASTGTYDMSGNVREWCWNASGDHRYVLGGAWNDNVYMAFDPYDLRPSIDPRGTASGLCSLMAAKRFLKL